MSPCIVPQLIWIGGVAPKWLLWKEVVEFMCMLLMSSMALGCCTDSSMSFARMILHLCWAILAK